MTVSTRLLFLIALLAAFPPLSTDMYLPAIPELRAQWQQPIMVINLTLIGFSSPTACSSWCMARFPTATAAAGP